MLPGTGGDIPKHSDVLSATPTTPEEIKSLVAEIKQRGNLAFKSKSYLESEILYSKALEHDPTSDPALWGNRSAARIAMKRFAEGLTDAEEAIKLGWMKGHFRKGQALAGLLRWRDAEAAFKTCVSLDPENKEAAKEEEKMRIKAEEEEEKMEVVVEDVSNDKKKKKTATDGVAKPSKSASTQSKSSSTKTDEADADDEDVDPSLMRGYKILDDGRKTTYFHREISAEEKQKLAQANKPVALTSSSPVPQAAVKEGGSAWNAAGTFEERDVTKWATDRIKELIKDKCSTVFVHGETTGMVDATNVTDFDGVASVSFIRGSRRFPFDFTFSVDWKASVDEGTYSGKLFYSEFTSDNPDFESEVRWENREKAGMLAKPLFDHVAKVFRKEIDSKLKIFIEEFRQLT